MRIFKAESSSLICRANEFFLRLSGWEGDTGRLSILIDTSSTNDSSNDVSILQSFLQWLQDHNTGAFSTRIPICAVIERVAFAVWAQEVKRSHATRGERRVSRVPFHYQ